MKALVVGCEGQDGTYLTGQLVNLGVDVYGISRMGVHRTDGTLLNKLSICDGGAIKNAIMEIRPEKIFYLAAYHHSSEEKEANEAEIIRNSFDVHVFGLLNVLNGLIAHKPDCKLFYAASSFVFGAPLKSPQNEETPIEPNCPYGISKAAGIHLCRLYRHEHNLSCSVGFLYNHESHLRQPRFASRKIVKAAVAMEQGSGDKLTLASLETKVDWGYAPEYTDAMIRILNLEHADDFVIASGHLSTTGDFAKAVFNYVGLDWRDHITINPTLLHRLGKKGELVGDSSRLRTLTGWEAKTNIEQLAQIMVDAERESTR